MRSCFIRRISGNLAILQRRLLSSEASTAVRSKLVSKVLVANRGEIACRVINTCKKLNIRTVAVYSDADSDAQHVKLADEAYYLGGSAASESYLKIDKILDICKQNGVQAVHPGYGFLSENAEFSAACKKIGVEFVGPPESAIVSMGSKSESKRIMLAAKVPCTPGYHGEDQSLDKLRSEAAEIGYPVMLKAIMGGGGKGMRIVRSPEEIEENIESCKREALSSFGDDRILIEKYLVGTRHIELQVFADKQGNCVHLFERDCSVQRRHQKILEEAPAPFLPEGLRKKMGEAAVNAAKAVNYVGAGTVEFMLDCGEEEVTEDTPFYFMEMNTRLQVEHPVTEMITGVDLVELQLRIASDQSLPFEQKDLNINGHAIEARIYAENPSAGFLPGSGQLTYLQQPQGEGIRVDTGVVEGDVVSVFYDPMISKLIVHGKNREEALKYMRTALDEYNIGGLSTNISFVTKCLATEDFKLGGVTTKFIENNEGALLAASEESKQGKFLRAAALAFANDCVEKSHSLFGFRNVAPPLLIKQYEVTSSDYKEPLEVAFKVSFKVGADPNSVNFTVSSTDDEALAFAFTLRKDGERKMLLDAVRKTNLVVAKDTESNYIFSGIDEESDLSNTVYRVKPLEREYEGEGGSAGGRIASPMPGKIVKVEFQAGDTVEKGQIVVVMEAMKMEHSLKAPSDGTVSAIFVKEGDVVQDNITLCVIESPEE